VDPIRPGTDAALVAGIAWVLINENLVDQPFLDKYCVGYDEKTLPEGAPLTATTKRIFSARAMTARRKRRSGPRGSPAFPPIASSSWPAKSAAPNRLISARAGVRSARRTAS
jgi:Tat-targeted selenate reductase subunit YnfE